MNTKMLHASSPAIAVLGLLVCAALPAQEIKRYKTASAIVQFTLSGAQTGTETLWFDRHGMREAKLTQTVLTVAGHTVKTNRLTILDGGTTTTADLDRKTATKMPTPMLNDLVEAAKKQGGDMTDLGTAMIQRMGAVKTGTDTVAGKPCDVWEIKSLGSKSWLWNGVTLRNETNFGGQSMKTIATSVQENVTIPEDKFALPAGITATEGANPLDALRKAREKMKGQ
jgi:outer membrane lipoprotein-sorting protein